MDTYRLTEEERKLLAKIDIPVDLGKERVTRPVVIAFHKQTGIIAGLSTLTQWRRMIQQFDSYKTCYRFELHNMW